MAARITIGEMIATGVATGVATNVAGNSINSGGWDKYNSYYRLPPQFTEVIDMMLIDDPRGYIGPKVVNAENKCSPGIGCHYFYWTKDSYVHYICFEKKMIDRNEEYTCSVSPFQTKTFDDAMKLMFKARTGYVRVISIDTSVGMPYPLFLEKRCKVAKTNQQQAIDMIIKKYTEKNSDNLYDYNAKVVICGPRGVGKTYAGRLLKKKLESDNTTYIAHLYDDFNPSATGCNVSRLVLQNATRQTHVILLIDEIDISYEKAAKNNDVNDRDPRLIHTQNKQTLNAMLDQISDAQYVTAIYTTELSPEKLYEKEEWRSFFRPGRVDFFIKMTDEKSTKIMLKDITGYVRPEN